MTDGKPDRSASRGPVLPFTGKRQATQRVQVGLIGLAAMILLVGLASIIMRNAQQNQALVVPEAAPTVAVTPPRAPASDPLADAGVVPDMSTDSAAAAPSGGAGAPSPAP
ncbi:hypothetical protein [Croceibacterium mercuriale]|uniref:hypothetical protein n=1 Tax=Croceibacterium mercuriale TaxID=1572751 RepID=UPI00126A5F58|nr:hypothetical protein [Croceibacterium mercuriale]